MPTLTIDGRTVRARDGAFVLEAARQAGVHIPTLCHHEAVEPYGGCRLCVVDVTRPEWDGWCKMVVACLFPVEEGLIVHTATERVLETRRVVLDLLLARCPDTPLIRRMAAEHGVAQTTYERNPDPTDCILCGLCTRVCDAIGPSAISSVDRGVGREIAPPFRQAPPACIGCLACAEVCPTGHIKFEAGAATRSIWGREFRMHRCAQCGRGTVTIEQAAFLEARGVAPRSHADLCDECKRRKLAEVSATLLG